MTVESRLLRLLAAASLALLVVQVEADQWYVEPRATLQTFYDDNVRLRPTSPLSSFGGKATAEVEAGRRTELSELGLTAEVAATRYDSAADLNGTDVKLGGTSSYRLGQSLFGLTGAINFDSTLTSEVETSGLVQTNKRRQRVLVSPSWGYTLSERLRLQTVLSYQDVSYEDVERIPLFDYSYATAGLTMVYALTERTQVFGRSTYASYDAQEVDTQSDTYGVEAGASYLVSERTSLTTYAGLRHTDAEVPTLQGTEESENSGPIFEAELTRSFDQGQLRLTADRAILPSSTGTMLDTTGLGVHLDYRLNQRWKLLFSARGYRNRSPDGESSSLDRDYFSVMPGVQHRLSQAFTLDVQYRYRQQDYESSDSEASSNALYLTLRYAKPTPGLGRWSRLEQP